MPRLLTHADLRPWLADARYQDALLTAVAGAYRHPHPFEQQARPTWLEAPLSGAVGEGTLRVFPSVAATGGTALRVDPRFQQVQRRPGGSRVALLYTPEGELRAIVEGDALYGLRIAVPVALAARTLAPASAATVGFIGTGAEATNLLPWLSHVLPGLRAVRAFSPTPEHRAAFVEQARQSVGHGGVVVAEAASAQAAVEGADVVAAVSSARHPAFEATWLNPGALVLAIGRGQVPDALVERARLVVATWATFRAGGGRTVADPARTVASVWDTARPVGELADALDGRVPARDHADDMVLFQLMGLPGTDAAILGAISDWAEESGAGLAFAFGGDRQAAGVTG